MIDTMKERAADLREQGLSYARIGEELGRGATTVQYWLNPDQAERNRERERERVGNYRSTLRGRMLQALRNSKLGAQRRGHEPVDANIIDLVSAWRMKCFICERKEPDLPSRLCIDHCHSTGRFRGWLCNQCNTCLGHAGDSPEQLENISYWSDDPTLMERAAMYLSGEGIYADPSIITLSG